MRLLLAVSLFFSAALAHAEDFHVVFDIDWTLVYPLEDAPKFPDPLVVEADGKWYRYSDGAAEVLERLSQRENVKISFFSGGNRARNLEVLEKLKLPSGRSAREIAFKILHAENMTRVSRDPKKKFSERFKKDLRKISPNLDRVILIDDVKDFTLPGQEKNLYWLGETYNFAASWEEAASRAGSEWEAPNRAAWERERKKILETGKDLERRIQAGRLFPEFRFQDCPSALKLLAP